MNNGFETNIEQVWAQFQELTSKQMTGAIKKAVSRGAAELKGETISQLHSSGIDIDRPNTKYQDKLDDGVMMRKAKGNYDEDIYSIVHIMGSRATGSGTFRLRFFEKGTKDRYQQTSNGKPLQKSRFLGSIKPHWFFKNANSTIESRLDQIYLEEIEKAIDKINRSQQ